ncbi:ComF family protein [Salinicola endophyticus]|uniref:ComF family protein n=1 Tax=Salinicola endophyticus TaxID=1949083 RepID=UPI0016600087|nr:ComF family protein [Salinicola endophyticus]
MFRRHTLCRAIAAGNLRWLLERGLRRALPGYCAFCYARLSGDLPWCDDCDAELPRNGVACRRCAEPMATLGGGDVCGRCLRRPPAFDAAWVPLRYEEPLVRLVQRFKFSADPRAGTLLVELLIHALGDTAPCGERLIGVPGSWARTRERGFDPVAWLGDALAERWQLPRLAALRQRDSSSQRGLDRAARRRNVKDAFGIEGPLPESVLLLDDVMTTGATLDALALACRRAGARHIGVVALARTPPDRI